MYTAMSMEVHRLYVKQKIKGIFALVSLFIPEVTNPKMFSVLVIQIEKHLCLQDRQKCLLKGQRCKLIG